MRKTPLSASRRKFRDQYHRASRETDAKPPARPRLSSPLAPTRSVLTPDRPRVGSSSIDFPTQDAGTRPNSESKYPEANNDMDDQVDTPTRSSRRRVRPKSSTKLQGLSPSLQEQRPGAEGGSNQDEIDNGRPRLVSSYTSPEVHARTPSRRPTATGRSASEPVTPGNKVSLSGFQLDGDIAKLIADGPKGGKSREHENGSIYFYKVKPRGSEVSLMKIGRTQAHPIKRLRQIIGICKHVEWEEHAKAVARDVPFHGFAEKLIHTELSNYQHKFLCVCGTTHIEYFQVSEDIAVKVFERWRDFCQEEPWDENGKILPRWARRLRNRVKFSGSEERDFDHHEFARPWDAFTTPTSFERILSDAILICELAFPNRWLIISLAELLTIVCISRQSFWTSAWTMVIVFFLLADLVITDNLHTTAHISQLMSGGLQSSPSRKIPSGGKSLAETEEAVSENSPESVSLQQNTEEAPPRMGENSPATAHQDHDDPRQAVDGENIGESRTFTDMGHNWDGDSEPPSDFEEMNIQEAEVIEVTP